MTLAAGTRLGPYEILAPLGAGGMGEVYRAKDTKLKRDVALKVLPSAVAADPERLARFQREAEVLAALNHPNIAQIYGVEDQALVMELVEGESPKGPMPFDEAWKIARQIAAGLDYAHEKGIVHRDLKPANIKVTPDGVVKLLDFGLAKAFTSQPAASGNQENSPTLTMHATQLGMILGTAGYMAPEQARGKPVDRRADIWAFGVVLYELLTGERLFQGEDVTETLAAIVKEQPDLSRAPREVQRLLRKCLEKDPKRRLRDIGDADELLDAPAKPPAAAAPASSGSLLGKAGWIAAAVLAVALGALGWVQLRARPAASVSTVRFQIAAPEGAGVGGPVIAPDGKLVVYPDGDRLWIHALNSLEARPLPGTENTLVNQSFWTVDSRFVVFGRTGKLWKVDVAGGPPQALCDLPGILVSGFSTPDGRIIFVSVPGGVQEVAVGGGTFSALPNQVSGGVDLRGGNPLLPDGRHFVYGLGGGIGVGSGIYVASLDGRESAKQLLPDRSSVGFAPEDEGGGYLLFRRESTLLAQRFDTKQLGLVGDPFPVAQGVVQFNVSAAGTLVYRSGAERKLTWFDRQGKALETAWTSAGFGELNLAPDGSRVAAVRVETGSRPATWLYEFARATSTRLVPQGSSVKPVWAPDGNRLVFSTAADTRSFALYEIPVSGSGKETALLPKSESANYAWDWSKDGRWLLYSVVDPKTKEDLWVLPMQGPLQSNAKPEPFLVTDATETDGAFSPDGRYVAYVSDESGKFEVYVRSFPAAGGAKWVVSSGGGYQPRWRRDGKELLYFTAEGRMMSVDVTPGSTFHASVPKFLFQVPIYGGGATTSNHYWDIAPDGQRFLINTYGRDSAAASMTVVLNWQAELKK